MSGRRKQKQESLLERVRKLSFPHEPLSFLDETDMADPEEEFRIPGPGFTPTPTAPDVYTSGHFRTGQKLLKEIVWSGTIYCVVRGPFPHGFPRTLTGKTEAIARTRRPTDICPRQEITSNHYALCRIDSIYQNKNKWGEVCP